MIGFAFSSTVWAKPPDGLVFFLAFDEGSGDKVNDLSGFGNHGIIEGKIDWIKGKFKGGFHFDGITHIAVKNVKPLTELTHPMSVAVWVNPDVLGGWRNIIEMDRTGASKVGGWKMGLHDSGSIVWTTYGVKDFISTTPLETGKWTHVVSTWDGAQAIVYVDGKPDAPIAGGGVIDVKDTADIPSLDLGWRRSSGVSTFQGGMDEVCIFKKMLSQNEITAIMKGVGDLMSVDSKEKLSTAWGNIKAAK